MEPFVAQEAAQMSVVIVREASRWGQARSDRVQTNMLRLLHYVRQIPKRPFARLHLSTPEGRRDDPALMFAYMIQISVKDETWPKFMSPCEQCGQPTGSWRDNCDNTHAALSTECEEGYYTCHECETTMGG